MVMMANSDVNIFCESESSCPNDLPPRIKRQTASLSDGTLFILCSGDFVNSSKPVTDHWSTPNLNNVVHILTYVCRAASATSSVWIGPFSKEGVSVFLLLFFLVEGGGGGVGGLLFFYYHVLWKFL